MTPRTLSPVLVAVLLAATLVAAVTFAPEPVRARDPPTLVDFSVGDVRCVTQDGYGASTTSTHDEFGTRYWVDAGVAVTTTGHVIDDATLTRVDGTTDEFVLAVTTTEAGVGATCLAEARYTAEFTLPVAIGEAYTLTVLHDGEPFMVDQQFDDGTTVSEYPGTGR